MSVVTQGAFLLAVDGRAVLETSGPTDQPTSETVDLAAGAHEVEITYSVEGTSGVLEWSWTPPGAEPSIVPPGALSPPQGVGVGQPLAIDELKLEERLPRVQPVETVP